LHDATSVSRIKYEIHINILIGVLRSFIDVYDFLRVGSSLLLTCTNGVFGRFRRVSMKIPTMALPFGPILISVYLTLSPEKEN